MPIYEYRRADGTTFELMQPMSAAALTHDPETGEPVERVLHAPAVHFKGSGFYNTDYGTRKRAREKEASSSSSSSENGGGSSGDSGSKKDGGGEGKAASSSSSGGSGSSGSSGSSSD